MRATCWMGSKRVEVQEVPDPKILNERDAIVRITSTAICGSDLHLYDGYIPTMRKGDILGHEFMGEVVEVGSTVSNLRVGDRVVVPFPIACGNCNACQRELYSVCENSNPNAGIAEKAWGHSSAGIFGYSHMVGGYAGGQAEYARVPFADVGPLKVNDDLRDEQVLFLSDILPTGYMGAELCDIEPGDVIAVWGAGPVGQFAIASAFLLGAERVIAIDRFPTRLRMAHENTGAETLNYEETDVLEALESVVLRGLADEGEASVVPADPQERQAVLRRADERAGELRSLYVGVLAAQGALVGAASLTWTRSAAAIAADVALAVAVTLRASAHHLAVYGVASSQPSVLQAAVELVAMATETDAVVRRQQIVALTRGLRENRQDGDLDRELPRVVIQQTSSRAAKEALEQTVRRVLGGRITGLVPVLGAAAGGATSGWLGAQVCEAARQVGRVTFLALHTPLQVGEVLGTDAAVAATTTRASGFPLR